VSKLKLGRRALSAYGRGIRSASYPGTSLIMLFQDAMFEVVEAPVLMLKIIVEN
jgi:hypothetical protein